MTETAAYEVLARRRRPQSFGALVGQEAMVRVLRNAFASGRIAHAFMLTGVRGVGKTTTARIVAKGLNCEGPEGDRTEPTIEPCGVCGPCRAIAEGRFIDVLEIDAASHTGVDFVRDINDMARTRPTARYKVFILDEVHMLSGGAFNALLKTLEEPPAHVKFIFATTEIRKVPPTVLSRCQRFDLRRIEPERMLAFLRETAEAEAAEVGDEALGLIARAAEGSARDALSLLDQAISHGGGAADAAQVRAMLGLADRARAIDLFERVMRGEAREALSDLRGLHRDGADPSAVLKELAEVAHWVSVVKVAPEAAEDPTVTPAERDRGRQLAEGLGMRQLSRAWQMLLKAIEEAASAPDPLAAAEMAVIRMTHVAELPSPEELVRRLGDGATSPAPDPRRGDGRGDGGGARAAAGGGAARAVATRPAPEPAPQPAPRAEADPALAPYAAFEAVLELIRERRDMRLLVAAETYLRLVDHQPGRIVFEPAPGAPSDLAGELTAKLLNWTGRRWVVSVVSSGGAPSVAERREARRLEAEAEAAGHPLVAAAQALFPGARIAAVRPLRRPAEAAPETQDAPEDVPGAAAGLDPDEAAFMEDAMGEGWEPVDPFDEE